MKAKTKNKPPQFRNITPRSVTIPDAAWAKLEMMRKILGLKSISATITHMAMNQGASK